MNNQPINPNKITNNTNKISTGSKKDKTTKTGQKFIRTSQSSSKSIKSAKVIPKIFNVLHRTPKEAIKHAQRAMTQTSTMLLYLSELQQHCYENKTSPEIHKELLQTVSQIKKSISSTTNDYLKLLTQISHNQTMSQNMDANVAQAHMDKTSRILSQFILNHTQNIQSLKDLQLKIDPDTTMAKTPLSKAFNAINQSHTSLKHVVVLEQKSDKFTLVDVIKENKEMFIIALIFTTIMVLYPPSIIALLAPLCMAICANSEDIHKWYTTNVKSKDIDVKSATTTYLAVKELNDVLHKINDIQQYTNKSTTLLDLPDGIPQNQLKQHINQKTYEFKTLISNVNTLIDTSYQKILKQAGTKANKNRKQITQELKSMIDNNAKKIAQINTQFAPFTEPNFIN